MKLIPFAHLRSTFARLAVLAALGLGASSPAFGVVLNISGGSGTPLSFTLPNPVTYTITQTAPGPFFVFQGAGDLFGAIAWAVTGSITYSVNGGAAQTVNSVSSGFAAGAVASNDLFFYKTGVLPTLTVGDTVVLTAGTLSTSINFAGATPASGNFQTFIVPTSGANISTFGTTVGGSVPDGSSTAALLGLGLLGLFSFARISRREA